MPAARVRRELLRTPQRVEKPLLALAFAPDRLPNTPVLGRFEPDSWSPSAQRRLFQQADLFHANAVSRLFRRMRDNLTGCDVGRVW